MSDKLSNKEKSSDNQSKMHFMLARTEQIAHIGSWEWIINEDKVR